MRRFPAFLLSFTAVALLALVHSYGWRYDNPGQQTQESPSSLDSPTGTPSSDAEVPGPSQALFNGPFYTCVRNFYVATTGNDTHDGSADSPWRTIQNADKTSRTGGDCINV